MFKLSVGFIILSKSENCLDPVGSLANRNEKVAIVSAAICGFSAVHIILAFFFFSLFLSFFLSFICR